MGAVASSVGNAFSGIGHGLESVAKSVGSVAEQAAKAVSKAGVSLDKAVNDVVPGGWYTVGAIAATVATAGAAGAFSGAAVAGEGAAAAGGISAGSAAGSATAAMTTAETIAAAQATASSILGAEAVGTASTLGSAAGMGGAAGTGLTATGATMSGVTGMGGALGTGLTIGGVGAGTTTPLAAALMAAGKGALIGGGTGGVSNAIRGKDVLQGVLKGALMGGLTGGALNSLSQLNTAYDLGLNPIVQNALVGVGKGLALGQDPSKILENVALSSGLQSLGQAAGKYDVNPYVTGAGTGAIASAIKGGDPLTGGLVGAGGVATNQALNEAQSLAAPFIGRMSSTSDFVNPKTADIGGNVESPVGVELGSKYLETAASDIGSKTSEYFKTLGEQQAELKLNQEKVTDLYNKTLQDQTALKNAFAEFSPVYDKTLQLRDVAQQQYNEITNIQAEYDTNKAAYEADNTNETAFNAANAAAEKLNSLIPQYNDNLEAFQTQNDLLAEVYTTKIEPLKETFEQSNNLLANQVSVYQGIQASVDKTIDNLSGSIAQLNEIASGRLPEDYIAPELSGTGTPTISRQQAELQVDQERPSVLNNTVPVQNNDGTIAYLNPETNTAYNLDGSVNQEATAKWSAPIADAGTTYEPTAGANVEQTLTGEVNPVTDVGGDSTSPLVPVNNEPLPTYTKDMLDEALKNGEITPEEYDSLLNQVEPTPPTETQPTTEDIVNQIIIDNAPTKEPVTPTPVEPTPVPVDVPPPVPVDVPPPVPVGVPVPEIPLYPEIPSGGVVSSGAIGKLLPPPPPPPIISSPPVVSVPGNPPPVVSVPGNPPPVVSVPGNPPPVVSVPGN